MVLQYIIGNVGSLLDFQNCLILNNELHLKKIVEARLKHV